MLVPPHPTLSLKGEGFLAGGRVMLERPKVGPDCASGLAIPSTGFRLHRCVNPVVLEEGRP